MHRIALAVATTLLSAAVSVTGAATPARAEHPRPDRAHIIAHFDRAAGQVAESVITEPGGAVDIGFILSRQVAHVTPSGTTTILTTMPLPADGGASSPTGSANVTGIERTADGTIYFNYSAGTSNLTGLWRLRPHGTPDRIAAFPGGSFLNGLTRDARTGQFYVTDSTLGRVWRVQPDEGTPTIWSSGPALRPTQLFGANGIKVHAGAVWVTNLDQQTLLRIPITRNGSAGHPEVEATSLVSADDFAFTGHGNDILAALNTPSELVLIRPGRDIRTVLTACDGLDDTTAVAVSNDTVYVTSGALSSGGDSNLLVARLRHLY